LVCTPFWSLNLGFMFIALEFGLSDAIITSSGSEARSELTANHYSSVLSILKRLHACSLLKQTIVQAIYIEAWL
jgi:hypothetical protein